MRPLMMLVFAAGLLASPMGAQSTGGKNEGSTAIQPVEEAIGPGRNSANAPARSASPENGGERNNHISPSQEGPRNTTEEITDRNLTREVVKLREALAVQQEQIRQLQKEMQAHKEALLDALHEVELLRAPHAASVEQPSTAAPQKVADAGTDGQAPTNVAYETAPDSEAAIAAKSIPRSLPSQNGERVALEPPRQKLTIGGLFFGDYSFYYKTGFGPQFLTQINPPGPGNNDYNAFEVSRAYLDLSYSPSDAVTLRLTPNIYRQIGAAPGSKYGAVGGIAANTNTELTYRLKYAYADFNTLFGGLAPLKDDKLTVGQQPNVLVDWEENLYGFRWVNLTPWNYLSLASAQTGVAIHGPVKFDGKQYLDYGVAVYGNSTFHTLAGCGKNPRRSCSFSFS